MFVSPEYVLRVHWFNSNSLACMLTNRLTYRQASQGGVLVVTGSVETPSSSLSLNRDAKEACVGVPPAGGSVAPTIQEGADDAGDGVSSAHARRDVSAGQAALTPRQDGRQDGGGCALPAVALPAVALRVAGDGVAVTHGEKVLGDQTGVAAVGGVAKTAPSSSPSPPSSAGLVLGSVGRDLAFEAAMVERLGRLVCEGALIEVVDVHKEVFGCVCIFHVKNLTRSQRILCQVMLLL